MASKEAAIPQFIVIRDQVHDTYKHPVVHYVFEDEPFPDVPKDKLITAEFTADTQLAHVDSYSPHFQVTDYRLEHSTSDLDDTMAGVMTIEGVSAPQANEAIESLQPVRNLDNLKETISNFKTRNEMVKNVFSK